MSLVSSIDMQIDLFVKFMNYIYKLLVSLFSIISANTLYFKFDTIYHHHRVTHKRIAIKLNAVVQGKKIAVVNEIGSDDDDANDYSH